MGFATFAAAVFAVLAGVLSAFTDLTSAFDGALADFAALTLSTFSGFIFALVFALALSAGFSAFAVGLAVGFAVFAEFSSVLTVFAGATFTIVEVLFTIVVFFAIDFSAIGFSALVESTDFALDFSAAFAILAVCFSVVAVFAGTFSAGFFVSCGFSVF